MYTKISQVVILYWPSWLSVAIIKHQPNHGGGAGGFIWLKVTVLHWGMPSQELEAKSMEKSCLLACFPWLGPPHQPLINMILAYRPINEGNSFSWVSLFPCDSNLCQVERKTNQCSYLLSFLMETPRRNATILPGNNKIKEDSNKLPTLSGGPLIFTVTLSATRDVVFTGVTS